MKYGRKKKYNTNNLGLTDLGSYDNITFSTFRFRDYECKIDDGYKKIYVKFKKRVILTKLMSHCYGVDILKSLILLYYKINNMSEAEYKKNLTNVIIDWCKKNVFPYRLEYLTDAESDQRLEMEFEKTYVDFDRSGCSFYQLFFINDLRRLGISYDYYINLKKYFETRDVQYIENLTKKSNIGFQFENDDPKLFRLMMIIHKRDKIKDFEKFVRDMDFSFVLDNILASFKPINLELKQSFKRGIIYKPKVDSIFDLSWYAFGKILTNETPNADTKDNKYFDGERIRICEYCKLPFEAKGRAKYCNNPMCQAARNRKNRNNSYDRTKSEKELKKMTNIKNERKQINGKEKRKR